MARRQPPSRRRLGAARVDVAGIGLNATDTLIRLPEFPRFDSKIEYLSAERRAGGQTASAMVACRRWGLRARYVGAVGDDAAGEFQRQEMKRERVEAHWLVRPGCPSQDAYILVDEATGERTILWRRDARLELRPEELRREWVTTARALLVDGHDARAAAAAAGWAREAAVPVVADVDNFYPGIEELLGRVDYVVGAREFPERVTGIAELPRALEALVTRHGARVAAATLGREGVLAYDGRRFHYAAAYAVDAVDTTGAGDIFHGAFVYALLAGWELSRMLDFSCAAAGLNSTAPGARGGIRPVEEIERLMREGRRHTAAYDAERLSRAAGGAWR